jgi:hypothetical protein
VIRPTQVLILPFAANLVVAELPAKLVLHYLQETTLLLSKSQETIFCLQRKKFHLVTKLKLHGQTMLRKCCLCFLGTSILVTMVRICNISKQHDAHVVRYESKYVNIMLITLPKPVWSSMCDMQMVLLVSYIMSLSQAQKSK